MSRTEGFKAVHTVPFNSKNKWMVAIVRAPTAEANIFAPGEDLPVLLIKGAPDVLFPSCSSYLAPDGQVNPLEEASRAVFAAIQEDWASRGQRVLLLGRRVLDKDEYPEGTIHDDVDVAAMVRAICIVGLVKFLSLSLF